MQELRLVAVSEDGTYCVLAVPGRGGRFVLPIDDRLRTVARGQFSRLAQYEIEVENPLRPKEIQDRIRAGETAEEIADAAGIPIDRVRRFEGPVLAEREFRAQEAQRSTVRGHTESGPGPRLGEVVLERLADAGASADTLAWDSRKRTDGNWQVQLQFTLDHRPQLAEWVFDPRRRHVIPADDLARRLCLPQADWPAGRLGALGAPSATVTPIGSRLGAHHADPRTETRAESRAESDRALARGAHAAPAPAPAHAPWSREAREPGWARETPTTQTPTVPVPVPVARQPEPDRAPVPLPAAQSPGADYATAPAQATSPGGASGPSLPAGTATGAADAPRAAELRAAELHSAELRAAELRVAELRAAETARTPAADETTSARPAASAGQAPATPAARAAQDAPAANPAASAAPAQSGRHGTTPSASAPSASTAPAPGTGQQPAASAQLPAATGAAGAAAARDQASAAARTAQAASAKAGGSPRDTDATAAAPASTAPAETTPASADTPAPAAGAAASEAPRPAEPAEAEAPPRSGRKARNRRASVPSWDEIMLGNSRQPD